MPKLVQSTLTILVAVYVLVVLIAVFLSDRLIFQPSPASYPRTEPGLTTAPVGQDSIALLYLPNPAALYTILFSHGNAEDLGDVSYTLRHLHSLGFAVVGYDYRGYGRSTDRHATSGRSKQDIRAAYQYVTRQLGIPADRIILYGRSVGSGPTMDLASRTPVAGVILESAFASVFTVMTKYPLVPFEKFPNARRMKSVTAPVLVIHGIDDEVIPVSHGRKLIANARAYKQSLFVEGAHHNDVAYVAGKRYNVALANFALHVAKADAIY